MNRGSRHDSNSHRIILLLSGTHTTPIHRYVDDLTFTFIEGSDPTCLVDVSHRSQQKKCSPDPLLLWQAYSQSETLSLLDYGTNYCNLRNLVDGAR